MYSLDFFKRCNIRLPDMVPQAVDQRLRGRFRFPNFNGGTSYRFSMTRKLHVRHLKAPEWAASRQTKGATTSTASMSSGDSAYMKFLSDDSEERASGVYFGEATPKDELIALQESAVRASLLKKLSDVNLYGRQLQRQLREKEDALLKCKSELGTMTNDIQALVNLAQEVANEGVKPGTRKINGKYIQSHLAIMLEELHERLLQQVENIEAACFRDVPLVWYGMAEDVKVMGSFDGWTQGFQLSPEFTGALNKFSATVKLRPGRYHIKFLVDGEWHVLPSLPVVGEGLSVNNLLVVE